MGDAPSTRVSLPQQRPKKKMTTTKQHTGRITIHILLMVPVYTTGFVNPMIWNSGGGGGCHSRFGSICVTLTPPILCRRRTKSPNVATTTKNQVASSGEWNSDSQLVEDMMYPEQRTSTSDSPTFGSTTSSLPPSSLSSSSSPSTVAGTAFNVMKAMLGSGCLALPSGLAAISDYRSSIWSANLLFVVLGLLSAYTFCLYGRLCHFTSAKSLGEIWKNVYQTEDSTPISLASFSFCYGSCLIFLLIIGDTMSSLARAMLSTSSNPFLAAGWLGSCQMAILSVMMTLLLPLCNLKSLAALSPVSIVGVLASIVSSAFVAWRCPAFSWTSPYHQSTVATSTAAATVSSSAETFLASLPAHHLPGFDSYSRFFSTAPLVLLGMGGMALMAHFSAPDFYQALAGSNANDHEQTGNGRTIQTKSDVPLEKYIRTTMLSFISAWRSSLVVQTSRSTFFHVIWVAGLFFSNEFCLVCLFWNLCFLLFLSRMQRLAL